MAECNFMYDGWCLVVGCRMSFPYQRGREESGYLHVHSEEEKAQFLADGHTGTVFCGGFLMIRSH